jgi:glucose-1-phosphate thymidylyltransferase
MKGLILAGGSGTRLRPITHTSAKQLVPVANKPILFYGIEHLAEAGIKEIGIVVGVDNSAAEIRAAVGDGSQWNVEVTYIPQEAPLGLAHAVLIARDYLGEDDFVMYLGDNLLRQGVRRFVEQFEADRAAMAHPRLGEEDSGPAAAQILLAPVPDPHRFGIAELDETEGHVVRLVEKPADPPSNLALVGVYLFDARVHEAVRSIEPSGRGELEITDAIQWLIDAGHRVRHQILEDVWIDTGKLQPLLEANRLVLELIEPAVHGTVDEESSIEGRVIIEAGAQVVRSTVRGPAVIGEHTRIVDSYVGPFTSVYHHCEITSSEIDHSVVLEHSKISGVPRIESSLIGRHVEVLRSARRPRATRLMLGDHSHVDLE